MIRDQLEDAKTHGYRISAHLQKSFVMQFRTLELSFGWQHSERDGPKRRRNMTRKLDIKWLKSNQNFLLNRFRESIWGWVIWLIFLWLFKFSFSQYHDDFYQYLLLMCLPILEATSIFNRSLSIWPNAENIENRYDLKYNVNFQIRCTRSERHPIYKKLWHFWKR